MIRLFGQTDKTFFSNGDVVIKPSRAKVKKQDNADFYLDLVCGIQYAKYINNGDIIVANTPQGDQAFRVFNPDKTGTKVEAKCNHVFFDSHNYLVTDSFAENRTCDSALNWFNNALTPKTVFSVSSDITKLDSYRCVRESFYTCIHTILERWGGHLVRDNFDIKIQEEIGTDKGILIQYAKNMKEITSSENWDDVVTQLLPVGKDGTLLNLLDPSASIFLTSDIQYEIPYTKTVSFEQDINREDYDSDDDYNGALVSDLWRQARAYLNENCVPKVNYTLKAHLDHEVDIGDKIHVRDKRLGLNLLTSVISYEYDCLTEKYTEIEFGNFRRTLSGLLPSIGQEVRNQTAQFSSVFDTKLLEQSAELQEEIGSVDRKVDEAVLRFYPIGSYYETSDASFDPNVEWGGTWVLEAEGSVHIGAGENYSVGDVGGEATHKLTVDEMPSHRHRNANSVVVYLSGSSHHLATSGSGTAVALNTSVNIYDNATGGDKEHNNMPPYIVVNRWHRTA